MTVYDGSGFIWNSVNGRMEDMTGNAAYMKPDGSYSTSPAWRPADHSGESGSGAPGIPGASGYPGWNLQSQPFNPATSNPGAPPQSANFAGGGGTGAGSGINDLPKPEGWGWAQWDRLKVWVNDRIGSPEFRQHIFTNILPNIASGNITQGDFVNNPGSLNPAVAPGGNPAPGGPNPAPGSNPATSVPKTNQTGGPNPSLNPWDDPYPITDGDVPIGGNPTGPVPNDIHAPWNNPNYVPGSGSGTTGGNPGTPGVMGPDPLPGTGGGVGTPLNPDLIYGTPGYGPDWNQGSTLPGGDLNEPPSGFPWWLEDVIGGWPGATGGGTPGYGPDWSGGSTLPGGDLNDPPTGTPGTGTGGTGTGGTGTGTGTGTDSGSGWDQALDFFRAIFGAGGPGANAAASANATGGNATGGNATGGSATGGAGGIGVGGAGGTGIGGSGGLGGAGGLGGTGGAGGLGGLGGTGGTANSTGGSVGDVSGGSVGDIDFANMFSSGAFDFGDMFNSGAFDLGGLISDGAIQIDLGGLFGDNNPWEDRRDVTTTSTGGSVGDTSATGGTGGSVGDTSATGGSVGNTSATGGAGGSVGNTSATGGAGGLGGSINEGAIQLDLGDLISSPLIGPGAFDFGNIFDGALNGALDGAIGSVTGGSINDGAIRNSIQDLIGDGAFDFGGQNTGLISDGAFAGQNSFADMFSGLFDNFLPDELGKTIINAGATDYMANKQKEAHDAYITQQEEFRGLMEPWRQAGLGNANESAPLLQDLVGAARQESTPDYSLNPRNTKVNRIDVFNPDDPALRFLQDEQKRATQDMAAAGGRLMSGGTLQELQDRAANVALSRSTDLANISNIQDQNRLARDNQYFGQKYDANAQGQNFDNNYFNQLFSVAGMGSNAAAGQGGMGAPLGAFTGRADASNARTAGFGNALGSMFSGSGFGGFGGAPTTPPYVPWGTAGSGGMWG